VLVRSTRSVILELSNPAIALWIRSFRGSTQREGSAPAPNVAPKIEPVVAPVQSVSHPPSTARPIVR
jgi:hypothetical protein